MRCSGGDQGIRVFLAKVSVTQIGDSPAAVEFRAIAQPNDWEAAVRGAKPPRLSDADALFGLLPPDRVEVARAILTDWEHRSDTWVDYASESLVLYAKNPRSGQGRCHVASISASRDGEMWLNPGRLQESQAFSKDDLSHYDELVDALLPPTTTAGGKGYYLAYPLNAADPANMSQLFDWILDRLAVAS